MFYQSNIYYVFNINKLYRTYIIIFLIIFFSISVYQEFYRKFISGDLGSEDDWGDLEDDDSSKILDENHLEINQTGGTDANHTANGETSNPVQTQQQQNSALQNISNLAANGNVSLAVVINGVLASINPLIVRNVQPPSIEQQMVSIF